MCDCKLKYLRAGTPKSLLQAIHRGFVVAKLDCEPEQVEILREHVKDFIAQKFTSAIFEYGSLKVSGNITGPLRAIYLKIIGDDDVDPY